MVTIVVDSISGAIKELKEGGFQSKEEAYIWLEDHMMIGDLGLQIGDRVFVKDGGRARC